MTKIDFYSFVPDKKQLLVSLVRKSLKEARSLVILTDSAQETAQYSDFLWQQTDQFLAHGMLASPNEWEQFILIGHECPDKLLQLDIILNLSRDIPAKFSRFAHLKEIVGLDEEDKAEARKRFIFYRERGYPIQNHDMRQGVQK